MKLTKHCKSTLHQLKKNDLGSMRLLARWGAKAEKVLEAPWSPVLGGHVIAQ